MIYNVPLALLSSYSDQDIVIRSSNCSALVEAVAQVEWERINSVQLLSTSGRLAGLRHLPPSLRIDLCVTDVLAGSDRVIAWSRALDGHPVRVVVPVIAGFSKVVKAALRAGLRVKLEIDQPDSSLVNELMDSLAFFIREPYVKEPVDLFYGVFRSFLTKQVESLWRIQEEHPSSHRYVTDSGEVTLAKRLSNIACTSDVATLLADHKLNLFGTKTECCTCRFFCRCEGYFKLPQAVFNCSEIKKFFKLVEDYAAELRKDLSELPDSSHANR